MAPVLWRVATAVAGLAWLASAAPLSAQAERIRVLRGTVRNQSDNAPIADVVIRSLDPVTAGATLSSASGAFRLRLPGRRIRLLAVRLGFAPETLTVAADQRVIELWLRQAPLALDPLSVTAEPTYSAASSPTIRELDIELRPRESAQELLALAPGLAIAQHAGGGKAEQIFLRGFDADHGTDVAVSVDGVPVNMVSHGHGQGYAELHFITPDVVRVGEVRKGSYDAQDGNLATAGAVNFQTRDRVDVARVETRAGAFNTVHGLTLVPFGADASRPGGYLSLSGHYTDGPTISPQNHQRFNAFAKFTAPIDGRADLVVSASGFDSRWDASGQIPTRAVEQGIVSRFGSIDPTEGGNTSRYDLSLGLRSSSGAEQRWEVRAYGVKYDFDLFSNFTFFLVDSIDGDGINQTDDRWIAGFNAWHSAPSSLGRMAGRTTVGVGGRSDWTKVGLNHSVRRRPLETWLDARVSEQHGFVWVKQEFQLAAPLRLQLGVRGDLFRFEVLDRPAGTPSHIDHASGTRTAGLISPKASLAAALSPGTSLFANLGFGFHSNDARAATHARAGTVLPRAVGAELGGRHVWPGGSVAAALWGLDLESELVYVGDEGTTEARGRTRRIGLDLEVRLGLTPWLWADADLNLSRGRFRDQPPGADRIGLAPTLTSTGGLTVRKVGRFSGGIRYRHFGGRSADETNTVRALGHTLTEVFGTWSLSRLDFLVSVDNLLNVAWNEAQFATTSRLRHEPAEVTELHFTPGSRRGLQVGAGYRF